MYNRRGCRQSDGPRGPQPGQGIGRGGPRGMACTPNFQQQVRMGGGRQGVHGGTMLGVHSGINHTLNPANRGPPGISAAALANVAANLSQNSAAGLIHSQQLSPNMASVAERLLVNQIQRKQQLQQQLQLQQQQQQQNLRQNHLHLQQQQSMRQNQLHLQQQQRNIQQNQLHQQTIRHSQNLQQLAVRPGLPHNMTAPNHSPPGPPMNSLMSQYGPGQRASFHPPQSVQHYDGGSGLRDGPAAADQRTAYNRRNADTLQQRPRSRERDRRESQNREPRSASDSQYFENDDRASRGSRGNSREDRGLRRPGFSRDDRRRSVSPDRRTRSSNDRSSTSDSSSNRSAAGPSSRGTSASQASQNSSQKRVQNRNSARDGNHRYISDRSKRSFSRDRDCKRTSSRERDNKRDSLRSQRSASSFTKTRQGDEIDSKRERLSRDEKRNDDTKRKREESQGTEVRENLDDRERRPVKRLRPDSRETRLEKEETAAEAAPKDSTPCWIRCSPADLYFTRDAEGVGHGTSKMRELEEQFEEELVLRGERARSAMPKIDTTTPSFVPCSHHHHGSGECSSSSSSGSGSSSDSDSDTEGEMCSKWMEEMERKRTHPSRMHYELWGNDPGEMNNGPLCRCSIKARRSGIRHDIYPGEKYLALCNPSSNNLDHLYHYHITMAPSTNFLSNSPTVIEFDNHEFIFEGFSLFTHEKLENVPLCKVIRFHIEYSIHFLAEPAPENFTVCSLDLFTRFLFSEILELVDLDWKGFGGGCNRFHLLPRFARSLPENGKEILSMNEVLKYLLQSSRPLVDDADLPRLCKLDRESWQSWVDVVCGMIVTAPGKKPSSVRVDQLDRTKLQNGEEDAAPILVHFGIRPAQLCYAGNPAYQKAWKQYIKFKHLLTSKPKVYPEDKEKLKLKEAELQEIQAKSTMKREVTVEMSTQGFFRTGLKSDVCQHALLLPVLMSHVRFHQCLNVLERHMNYMFQDRTLLQLALTHTSFRNNYGTNSAHVRNSLTNCGLRQVEYGDHRVYYQNTRKRGINILVDIMSRLGRQEETMSEVPHNERLEFLGDAVVEFLSSVHLFFLFHWLEEGGLSTYRTALVQNQHLSILAKNLHLQDFMLYVHGPDLCHESDLRHAMANCFEALMGALFLDGGLATVDRIFGSTLFADDPVCLRMWENLPLHPLQEDEPGGDRHWVDSSPALQKLITFEDSTGLSFSHVRLLAKAFTHRSVGSDNLLTMGHNQRLEFLGDTVLQLIASEYLYKHFPEHHEGHLSLLRSSLVNSRTQSIVCDDLGMTEYVIYEKGNERGSEITEMKTKQKADLLEAFLGSLYVDGGMESCMTFCEVCFFPRLKDFILNQDWNDPKSQLQQCCLTLRKMGGGEPDIPFYKVIESLGPSNTRKYIVAVYFRGERLATGTGHSIQQAEMSAANNALKIRSELFPILQHQRRFLVHLHKEAERRRKPRQYRTPSITEPRKSRSETGTTRPRKPPSSLSTTSRRSTNSRSSSSSSMTSNRFCRRNDSGDRKPADVRDGKSTNNRRPVQDKQELPQRNSYNSSKRSSGSSSGSKFHRNGGSVLGSGSGSRSSEAAVSGSLGSACRSGVSGPDSSCQLSCAGQNGSAVSMKLSPPS